MRTFNVRLAGILGVLGIVFCVAVWFWHGHQLSANATIFLDQAKVAEKEAEEARKKTDKKAERMAVQKQLDNLGWFFKLAPNDEQALDAKESYGILMAESYFELPTNDSFGKAVDSLNKVVVADSQRSKARRELVKLLMHDSVRRYKDALGDIKHFLDEKPDDPEMLTLLGECQAGTGEPKKAKDSFRDAIKFSPQQVDAYYQLAALLQEHPELCEKPEIDPEKTGEENSEPSKEKPAVLTPETVMAAMMEKNPDSAKAHYYMANHLLRTKTDNQKKTVEEALGHAQKSLGIAPDDRETLYLAARCSLLVGQPEEARKYALQGLDKEKDPTFFRTLMYTIQTDAEYDLKNHDQAVETLKRAFKDTKDPHFLWRQIDDRLNQGDAAGAEKSLAELASLGFDNSGLDYLRGRIAFLQRKWSEAIRSLENSRSFFTGQSYRARLINMPTYAMRIELILSDCYGALQNTDQQVKALERVLEINPSFEPAIVALTELRGRDNMQSLPLDKMLQILRNSQDQRTVSIMIPRVIAAKKQLPKEDQNWKELEGIFDDIQKKFPDFANLPLHRCELMIAQEKYAETEETLRNMLRKDPKDAQFWNALVLVLMHQKKLDEVEKMLAIAERKMGDTLELRMMKTNFCLQKFGKDAVPHLKSIEEKTDAFDDQQKTALRKTLLAAFRAIGARDEVRRLTQLLADEDPGNIQYLIMSFEQANEAADLKRMQKIADDIEKLEGNGPYWLYAQAWLRVQKSISGSDPTLLDQALALLEQAKDKRANWPKIPSLMGHIYYQKKDPVRALRFYQDAVEMGEYHPLVLIRIVDILCQQQHLREAHEFLNRLEGEGVPLPIDIMRNWTALLLDKEMHDYETALEKARKVAKAKTDNYKDYLWYAQALLEIERKTRAPDRKAAFNDLIPEAEKSLRRAVELKPDATDAWIFLINFLVAADKLSDAENALDQARKTFTGKEGPMALAQCLEVLKKTEQAKDQYQLALAADPQNGRITRMVAEFFIRMGSTNQSDRQNDLKQAETLLNRIIEGKEVKAEKEDVMWARRSLAWLLLNRPGYENVDRARMLLRKNLEEVPDSPPDTSLMAFANANDPKQSNKESAIEALKQLRKSGKASDTDMYQLAQLLLANKNWLGASEVLRELAVNSGDDPRYLGEYIQELLNHGEVSDAEVYLNKLVEKWPNLAKTALLKAELLVRRGKAEEALDLMKGFVDLSNAVPADRSQRVHIMALAMENFASRVTSADQADDAERFIRTAEMYLRQYVDEHPSAVMEVVVFLARQKRFEDAADALEQNWKTTDPASLHKACMLVTDAGRGPKEVVDRVKKILEEAKTQFENHPTVILALGDINAGEGNYKESEAYYREILEKNAGHAIAMNNLAVLLTLSKNNLSEAEKMINKAIGITGPLAQMLDTRACIYIAAGNKDKALADMKDVIADGKTPERLFHYAMALELAGQDNAAAVEMQKALADGLSEKKLMTPEIPSFRRLRDKAHALSPIHKK